MTLIGGGADMTDLDDARAMTHVLCLWTCWNGKQARTFEIDKISLDRGTESKDWVKHAHISSVTAFASSQNRDALHTTPDPIRPFVVAKTILPCHAILLSTYWLRLDTLARYLGL